MKKKKKLFRLLAMFLVLVLLVGGYVAITVLHPFSEEETTGIEDTQEEEKINVASYNEDHINEITYTKGKTKIHLVKKKDTWTATNDADCPVNKYTVNAMLTCLKEVTASRKIEDDSEEDFGLDNPTKVITFVVDGETVTYTIGAKNAIVDKYYFQCSGDDAIYMIDSTMYNSFDYDLLGLAQVPDYPSLTSQTISYLTLQKGDKTVYIVDTKDAAHKSLSDEIPDPVWAKGSSKSKVKKMDTDTADDFIEAVLGLTNTECVTYKATQKDMEKYGISKPSMVLTVHYTKVNDKKKTIQDKSYQITFGKTDKDSGEYYVYTDQGTGIYTMNVSNVDTLLQLLQ